MLIFKVSEYLVELSLHVTNFNVIVFVVVGLVFSLTVVHLTSVSLPSEDLRSLQLLLPTLFFALLSEEVADVL